MKKKSLMYQGRSIKITDFVSVIPWEQIEAVVGKRHFKNFTSWMYGQTCTKEGVYQEDLERWINGWPIVD